MFATKKYQNPIFLNIEIYYIYYILYHMFIKYKIHNIENYVHITYKVLS